MYPTWLSVGSSAIVQCIDRQGDDQTRRSHRPADDASRVQVHHHRQVQPTLPGPELSDVGCPALITFVAALKSCLSRFAAKGMVPGPHWTVTSKAPLRTAFKAAVAHQAGHFSPATSTVLAGVIQYRGVLCGLPYTPPLSRWKLADQ